MKKLLIALIAVLVAFALASCEEIIKAELSDTLWFYDEGHHWHIVKGTNGDEVVDKAEHSFSEWTVTVSATSDTDGEESRKCTVCGYQNIHIINHLTKTTFYESGKKKQCVEFDSKGNVLKIFNFDEAGNETRHVEYTYHENGKRSSVTTFRPNGNKSDEYYYNESGTCIQSIDFNAEGIKTRVIDYNDDGSADMGTYYDHEGNVTGWFRWFWGDPETGIKYDALGKKEVEYVYDSEGMTTKATYYDNNENVSEYALFFSSSDVEGNIVSTREYYDSSDNKTETIVLTFDHNGNQIRSKRYDSEDVLISWVECRYDTSGSLVERFNCDEFGNRNYYIMPRYFSYNPATGSSYSGADTYSKVFKRYYLEDSDMHIICYPHSIYMTYIRGGGTGDDSPDYAYREAFYWYLKTYLNKTSSDINALIENDTIDSWLEEISEDFPIPSSNDVSGCNTIIVSPEIPARYSDNDHLIVRDVFFYKNDDNYLKLKNGSPVNDGREYIVTEDWDHGQRHVCWIFLPYSFLESYESQGITWDGSHHIFIDYLVSAGILSEETKNNYNYDFVVSMLKQVF